MLLISDINQSDINKVGVPTAIALGNFDGIHQGHQRVIAPVLDHSILGNANLISTVVTFEPHPQEFFGRVPRLLLTPLPEKAAYLEQIGVEQLILLPFTTDLAQLSAKEFIEQILISKLQAQIISVGFNFKFGYRRSGSVKDLLNIWGDRLHIIPQATFDGERISSSAIRDALSSGDVARASCLLGRNYTLSGIVISGQKIGRTIGFPTANIQTHPRKFLPRNGVYAVRVNNRLIEGNQKVNGVMNIGIRPTIADPSAVSRAIEVHILNWQGDLYGTEISVEIIKFLRPEQKFESVEQLKQQIKIDCEQAII